MYVGPGNNSLLIKSLLKRRPWLEVVENVNEDGVQFYWTQNKINEVHDRQENAENCIKRENGGNPDPEKKKPSVKVTA